MTDNSLAPGATPLTDRDNPWLGLAPFGEENRAYFFGREEEVAELARRVQRKLLTVLFGQSGLGKTSILRAGLVPRLRSQGYCPVYVRIDYGREAPEPAEQIKAAIARTARGSGEWTQVGVAAAGETLWEFLHHRDDVLRDENGATLIPLLIFDQFEEIFTLGQSDDFGRARAAHFLEDLADLVENRPPRSLEARLEADEGAAERFDFARSDYRVLIALREDYLAPLEGVKGIMPSVTQNRLRLAPMTGPQALEAVQGPGRSLVNRDVAEAIVRFVAGGAELANAEVEPSLLSLICRELNDTRIAAGRAEISLELLEGSRSAILTNFYERALADQPPSVRRIIEDDLLTESGFRENIAEESMQARLAAAGAAPGALATLVNRRLLRIEERLDVRRVELTHDVLCDVVRASRDLRHEREQREATERVLAEQHERELAARRALVRARQVATGCVALAVLAIGAAVFAVASMQRAHRAELAATATRQAAENARSQAEHLIGYLNDDFATELEGFGRLSLLKELVQRERDYYASLPPALQTTDTRASAALAAVRFGIAEIAQGHAAMAGKGLEDAVRVLEDLRKQGDRSERMAIGLSLGLGALGDVADRLGGNGLPRSLESEAVLRPYAEAPGASVPVRRAYGLMALSLGTYQGVNGFEMFERAKRAFASLGARNLSDVAAAAQYASTASFEGWPLYFHGQPVELKATEEEAVRVAEAVLEQRPGHFVALRAAGSAYGWLAASGYDERHLVDGSRLQLKSAESARVLMRLDPSNVDDRQSYSQAMYWSGNYLIDAGQTREGIARIERGIEIYADGGAIPENVLPELYGHSLQVARAADDIGDAATAAAARSKAGRFLADLRRRAAPDSQTRKTSDAAEQIDVAWRALAAGRLAEGRDQWRRALTKIDALPTGNANIGGMAERLRAGAYTNIAEACYRLGDYAGAVAAGHAGAGTFAEAVRTKPWGANGVLHSTALEAAALVRLGRSDEARRVIAAPLAVERAAYARNHDAEFEKVGYAIGLWAEALADPQARERDLAQAERVLAALKGDMRQRASVRVWADIIAAERGHGAGGAARGGSGE